MIESENISKPVKPQGLKEVPKGKTAYQIASKGIRKHGFWKGIKRTLSGENKAGKILEIVKGIALTYLPFGKQLKRVTDIFGNALKTNTMSKNDKNIFDKIKRILKQDSTKAGLGFIVTALLGWFGLHFDFTALFQGVLGILTGLSAVYTALRSIINVFKDHD